MWCRVNQSANSKVMHMHMCMGKVEEGRYGWLPLACTGALLASSLVHQSTQATSFLLRKRLLYMDKSALYSLPGRRFLENQTHHNVHLWGVARVINKFEARE